METQPFEQYEKLAQLILHAATHWKVDMTTWNALLENINNVCSETARYRKALEKIANSQGQASFRLKEIAQTALK